MSILPDDRISQSSRAEAAQNAYVEHLVLVAEFADLAARAAAMGDTFGASRYTCHAHEHVRESWRALAHWRDQLAERRVREEVGGEK